MLRSGQVLDIFPAECCESPQISLQVFLSEQTASLNLSLVVEEGRTSREVAGFGGV